MVIIFLALLGMIISFIAYKAGEIQGWNDAYDKNGKDKWPGDEWSEWRFRK